MGDKDKGDADLVLNRLYLDLHLLAQFEVECTQRFIKQQHTRMVDQRPRQRHPLLLPAGELRWLAFGNTG